MCGGGRGGKVFQVMGCHQRRPQGTCVCAERDAGRRTRLSVFAFLLCALLPPPPPSLPRTCLTVSADALVSVWVHGAHSAPSAKNEKTQKRGMEGDVAFSCVVEFVAWGA